MSKVIGGRLVEIKEKLQKLENEQSLLLNEYRILVMDCPHTDGEGETTVEPGYEYDICSLCGDAW